MAQLIQGTLFRFAFVVFVAQLAWAAIDQWRGFCDGAGVRLVLLAKNTFSRILSRNPI
jgi:hypothetical protein